MHHAHPPTTVGVHKSKYWDPVYEDSLDLIAKLPGIAAAIYRNTYKGGDLIAPAEGMDWAGNLAVMMGVDKDDTVALDMMRMYQTIHAGTFPRLRAHLRQRTLSACDWLALAFNVRVNMQHTPGAGAIVCMLTTSTCACACWLQAARQSVMA